VLSDLCLVISPYGCPGNVLQQPAVSSPPCRVCLCCPSRICFCPSSLHLVTMACAAVLVPITCVLPACSAFPSVSLVCIVVPVFPSFGMRFCSTLCRGHPLLCGVPFPSRTCASRCVVFVFVFAVILQHIFAQWPCHHHVAMCHLLYMSRPCVPFVSFSVDAMSCNLRARPCGFSHQLPCGVVPSFVPVLSRVFSPLVYTRFDPVPKSLRNSSFAAC
jgi:hypothetical protein